MNYTPNYQLNKPEKSEQFNIEHWNINSDKIDTALHNLQTEIDSEVSRAETQEETNRNIDRLIGILPISKGGTGKTTTQDALNELHKNVSTENNIDSDDEITFIKRTQADVSLGINESIDVKDVKLNTLANKVFELLKADSNKLFSSTENGFTPKTNSVSLLNFLRADGVWGVPQLQEDIIDVLSSNSYSLNSNTNITISAENPVTIVLSDPSILGLTVTFINKSANLTHSLSCSNVDGSTVDKILPNAFFKIAWNGTGWVNITAPAVTSTFTQYPQQSSPEDVYPCTKWTVIDYGGAFFRAENGNANPFIDSQSALTPQGQATAKNGLKATSSSSFSGNKQEGAFYPGVYVNAHGDAFGVFDWRNEGVQGYRGTVQDNPSAYIHFQMTPTGSVSTSTSLSSDDIETRPMNYTIRIWKRIS